MPPRAYFTFKYMATLIEKCLTSFDFKVNETSVLFARKPKQDAKTGYPVVKLNMPWYS